MKYTRGNQNGKGRMSQNLIEFLCVLMEMRSDYTAVMQK